MVASPTILRDIPKRSRIVIADIGGPCTLELKNALMTRLVDNSEYDVLTRDNLEQLLLETENNWSGPFNTKTAATLGELLGASLFVVGNVVYCGRTEIEEESEKTWQYNMLAVLQILDLETGKVLMSSADQGKYRPETSQLLVPADPSNKVRDAVEGFLGDGVEEGEVDSREIEVNFPIFKAAEDLANDFADKFFSRPSWENLEMWMNSYWRYGDSIRLVKLGHCSSAVDLLEGSAARELRMMPEKHVAEYLHNYGVALLCDNQVTPAMEKLRSAFRVTYEPTTLRMLDMAAKVDEWNLEIKIDEQPEIERLLRRGLASAR
ncbi:MAG: CsgG/HfaB family protein [Acidobacteriota bacterium]